MFRHQSKPIALARFNAAVEKQNPGTVRLLRGNIVYRGTIRLAAKIDNHSFEIWIVGFLRKRLGRIAPRRDDGNLLWHFDVAPHPISVRSPIDRDVRASADSLQMAFDGATTGLERARFAPNIVRHRTVGPAPVIENARHVMDAICLFDHAQKKIVILRTIKFGTKPTSLMREAAPEGGEVADIIVGEKKIRRPIRFEHGRGETL